MQQTQVVFEIYNALLGGGAPPDRSYDVLRPFITKLLIVNLPDPLLWYLFKNRRSTLKCKFVSSSSI